MLWGALTRGASGPLPGIAKGAGILAQAGGGDVYHILLGLGALLGLGVAAWVFTTALRAQVRARTAELRRSERRYRQLIENLNDAAFVADVETGLIIETNARGEALLGRSRREIIGMHQRDLHPPEDAAHYEQTFQAHASGTLEAIDTAEVIRRDGTHVPVTISVARVDLDDRELLIGLFRDKSELRQAHEDLKQRARETAAVSELAREVGRTLSVDGVITAALRALRKGVRADMALIYTLNGEELVLRDTDPSPPDAVWAARASHRVGRCLCGEVAASREPLYSKDIWLDPRCTLRECKEAGFRSFAGLPLARGDQLLGVACLTTYHERDFHVQSEFLETLANAIAAGLQNARLYEHSLAQRAELQARVAEREAAKQALLRSESLFRGVFEASPIGIAILDAEGRAAETNAAFRQAFGITGEADAVGLRFLQVLALPDAVRSDARHGEIISQDLEFDFAAAERAGPLRTCRSGRIFLDVRVGPLGWGPGEQPTGYLLLVNETTRRRAAEEALRQSEERYRELVQQAASIIVRIGTDGRLRFLNEYGQRFFGLSEEDAFGRPVVGTIVPPMDSAGHDLDGMVRDLVADPDRHATVEMECMRRNGQRVWVTWANRAVRDAQGRVAEILSVGTDMTDRIKAQEEIERVARFPAENPNPVLRVSADGRVIYSNKASRPLLEAWGVGEEDRLPGDHCQYVREAMLAGQVRQAEVEAAGRIFALWHTPVPDGDYVNIYGLDITDRRHAEEELAHQHQVLERAARLESIGKLAGGVAHDFNNLLTGILGYCDLLLGGLPEGSRLRSDVREIERAGRRAADLTRQLLAFSRKQVLSREPLDLNVVVRGMSGMLRRLIGENIDFSTRLAPDLAAAELDPAQIEQVVMNLVVNSRDAMPNGGKLTIETANAELDEAFVEQHPGARAGLHVMLAVSDTGFGMDAETQAHIFEPFFTTKENGQGTGLGLATAYGIVKQHGGSIWAYSEPGKGTTFRIYLPRVGAEARAGADAGALPGTTGGAELVLLVEDEEAVRDLAERILCRSGYSVLTAPTAEDALRTMAECGKGVALLLTDVVLPGKSGPVLYEDLKDTYPELAVLYMSGYTGQAVVRHGMLEPGGPFIAKPFGPDDLLRKVRETLDQAS
jgi:two-component system cell cycle sensor histidine kinase/response regulator CckA